MEGDYVLHFVGPVFHFNILAIAGVDFINNGRQIVGRLKSAELSKQTLDFLLIAVLL
jgi:hypothetical protein